LVRKDERCYAGKQLPAMCAGAYPPAQRWL